MRKVLLLILIFCTLVLYGCQNTDSYSQSETDISNNITTQTYSEDEYTGLWTHIEYPDAYSLIIFDQQDNKISFEITAVRGNGAQIATAQIADVELIDGKGIFEFTDSFDNSGNGKIAIIGDTLSLEYNTNGPYQGNWCIDAGQGNYKKTNEISEMPEYAANSEDSSQEEISLDDYIDTGVFLKKIVGYAYDDTDDIYDNDLELYIGEYEHDVERYENGKKIIETRHNAHFFQEKIYDQTDRSTTGYCKAYKSDRAGYAAKLVIEFYDNHTEIMYLKVIVPKNVFEFVRENGEVFGRYETYDYATYRDTGHSTYINRYDREYKTYYKKPSTWTPFDE